MIIIVCLFWFTIFTAIPGYLKDGSFKGYLGTLLFLSVIYSLLNTVGFNSDEIASIIVNSIVLIIVSIFLYGIYSGLRDDIKHINIAKLINFDSDKKNIVINFKKAKIINLYKLLICITILVCSVLSGYMFYSSNYLVVQPKEHDYINAKF